MRIVSEVADTQLNALVSGIFDLLGGIRILLGSVFVPAMVSLHILWTVLGVVEGKIVRSLTGNITRGSQLPIASNVSG